MRATTIFNRLLQLQGAFVKDVRFEPRAIRVTIQARTKLHRCAVEGCGYSSRAGYDSKTRTWRAVSLGAWPVYLEAHCHRVHCPEHGVRQERVSWAASGSTFTYDFEEIVAWLAKQMNFTAVTELIGISWQTVSGIVERFVSRKLDQKRLDGLYRIGIDEVSYRKGHKYITTIANHDSRRVVAAQEGRSKKTVSKLFDSIGEERIQKLEVVTMDMSEAFLSEVNRRAPHVTIAFDPFHVVKLANEALQEVRRGEARDIKGTPKAQFLKGSRWALLRAPETLSEKEELRLADVAKLNSKTYRAYLLKEELRALYQCSFLSAGKHLAGWLAWASRSKLEPFIDLAKTIRRHRAGILAAIRFGLANGLLEGINNKIGMLKHRAFGFHSPQALIAMVFLTCGDVPTSLPRLPTWI